MPFDMTIGFATEHDKDAFVERTLPKLRGKQFEPVKPEGTEHDGLYRIGISVTSQSAAKDVCHQIVSFLSHAKGLRVNVFWLGADGEPQSGEIEQSSTKTAEIISMRVAAAAKSILEEEKEAETGETKID